MVRKVGESTVFCFVFRFPIWSWMDGSKEDSVAPTNSSVVGVYIKITKRYIYIVIKI